MTKPRKPKTKILTVEDRLPESPAFNEWPDEVPILSAEQLTWNYSTNRGAHDLMVWLSRVFGSSFPLPANPKQLQAQRVLEEVIAERLDEEIDLWTFLEKAWKERTPSLAWQAAAWNEAMSRLDYDIPLSVRKAPRE